MPEFPLLNVELPARLSAEESGELAMHVAELAKAGLPLDGGLHALSEELPNRRVARVLRRLADRLASGVTLDEAIAAQGRRLPAHLRALIVAGVRSGRLAATLDEFVSLSRRQRDLRRRIILTLLYPGLLLGMMTMLLAFFQFYLVDEFAKVFRDFGMRLPVLTELLFGASRPMGWVLMVMTATAILLPLLGFLTPLGAWLARVFRWIPIAGPILRWGGLAELSQLLAMLVEQHVPLPQALRLAAGALRDRALADGCRQVAAEVEAGRALDACLAARSAHFPPSMAALVAWVQRGGSLREALRASAEVFDARARTQSILLETVLPALAFLVITLFSGLFVIAVMLPLASLISNLSN